MRMASTGMDAVFAKAAATNKAKLDSDFSYRETPSEEFAHEVEIGVVCYFAFIGFVGVWIAHRTYRFRHSH